VGEAAQQGGRGGGVLHDQFIQPRQMGARKLNMLLRGSMVRKVPLLDLCL
jgi:hypothetical protein